MTNPNTTQSLESRQDRPTVARWRFRLSLRVRLALLVALVVTALVGAAGYLETRLFEASVLRDLTETAHRTAQAVADDIELHPEPIDADELADTLHEFAEAVTSIRGITVVRLRGGGVELLASTSSKVPDTWLDLAARAISTNTVITAEGQPLIRTLVTPFLRNEQLFGAVILSYSVASAEQLRRRGRSIVLWFVPSAILAIALLVDGLARKMIHQPLAMIRQTMRQVATGERSARAQVTSEDEIGEVARGLNDMLGQIEGFHDSLQEKVRDATEELRRANQALGESYDRLVALREALARAERMAAIGQTAASVAHQVGTPLNLISGHVQMIREQEGPDSPVTRRLQIVGEQITKVASIVRALLDRARQPYARVPTDLGVMIRRVAEIARPRLEALGIELLIEAAPELPPVSADEAQLELALLNLVTNSVDALRQGGSIVVSVTAPGRLVRVEVADTGPGISPEVLPRLFQPWVTTKQPGQGTGLGLSITREVVESHGGTIVATSRPGSGAVFVIELPAAGSTDEGEGRACTAS